ncbi:hypothetical protein [Bartonella sp. MR63HLJHH]|uniref:hypothetical protein n=1 Tax=Bartonella sp. MR63HLJHH TaxID=3243558 RepID=UPI0035CF2D44
MSSKLPWTRLFADRWLVTLGCLSPTEKCIYVMLRLLMLHTGEPILKDLRVLAFWVGYPVEEFETALNSLIEGGFIIRLDNGGLWNPDVELELNDSKEKSEAATKAAHSRWHKTKGKNDNNHIKENAYADCMQSAYDAHSVAQCERNAINNNINIYKKNKTNVLLKKEIDFEDLETIDLVDEPIECDVESQSEQTNQPPIHEQTSVPKKAKRSKGKKELGSVPEDFEPDLQYAIDKGLTHDEALLEFERFKLHWKANPCRNANNRDWQSAWCGWIINQNGTLAKKLEQEKRYANERYKLSTNNFTNSLSQSFSTLKAAITTSNSYGSECSRDTEAISSFASTCQESGPECVPSNLYAWKAVDAGGEIASFARL